MSYISDQVELEMFYDSVVEEAFCEIENGIIDLQTSRFMNGIVSQPTGYFDFDEIDKIKDSLKKVILKGFSKEPLYEIEYMNADEIKERYSQQDESK